MQQYGCQCTAPIIVVNPGEQNRKSNYTYTKQTEGLRSKDHGFIVVEPLHEKEWKMPQRPHHSEVEARNQSTPFCLQAIKDITTPTKFFRERTENKDKNHKGQDCQRLR